MLKRGRKPKAKAKAKVAGPKAPVSQPVSAGVKVTGPSSAIGSQVGTTEEVHCLLQSEATVNDATYMVPVGPQVVPSVVAAVLRDSGRAI